MFSEEEKKGSKALPPPQAIEEEKKKEELLAVPGKRPQAEEVEAETEELSFYNNRAKKRMVELLPLAKHPFAVMLPPSSALLKLGPKAVFKVSKAYHSEGERKDANTIKAAKAIEDQAHLLAAITKEGMTVYSLTCSYVCKHRADLLSMVRSGEAGIKAAIEELTFVTQLDLKLREGLASSAASLFQMASRVKDIQDKANLILADLKKIAPLVSENSASAFKGATEAYNEAVSLAENLTSASTYSRNFVHLVVAIESFFAMLRKTYPETPEWLGHLQWLRTFSEAWQKTSYDAKFLLKEARKRALELAPYLDKILGNSWQSLFKKRFNNRFGKLVKDCQYPEALTINQEIYDYFLILYNAFPSFYFYSEEFDKAIETVAVARKEMKKRLQSGVPLSVAEQAMYSHEGQDHMYLDMMLILASYVVDPAFHLAHKDLPFTSDRDEIDTQNVSAGAKTPKEHYLNEYLYRATTMMLLDAYQEDFILKVAVPWKKAMKVDLKYLDDKFTKGFEEMLLEVASDKPENKQRYAAYFKALNLETNQEYILSHLADIYTEFNWIVDRLKDVQQNLVTLKSQPATIIIDKKLARKDIVIAGEIDTQVLEDERTSLMNRLVELTSIEKEAEMKPVLLKAFGTTEPFTIGINNNAKVKVLPGNEETFKRRSEFRTSFQSYRFTEVLEAAFSKVNRQKHKELLDVKRYIALTLSQPEGASFKQVVRFSNLNIAEIREAIRRNMKPFFLSNDKDNVFQHEQTDIAKAKTILFPVGSGNYQFHGLAISSLATDDAVYAAFLKCLTAILNTHMAVYHDLQIAQADKADLLQIQFVLYINKEDKKHYGTKYTDGIPMTMSEAFKKAIDKEAEKTGESIQEVNVRMMIERLVKYCRCLNETKVVVGSDQLQFYDEDQGIFSSSMINSIRLHSVQVKPVKVQGLVDTAVWFTSTFENQKPKSDSGHAPMAIDKVEKIEAVLDGFKTFYASLAETDQPYQFRIQMQGIYGAEDEVIITEDLNEALEEHMEVHFRTIDNVHRKILPLIKARDYLNVGICGYEAFLMSCFPRKIDSKQQLLEWGIFVLTSLNAERDEVKQSLASGKIKSFLPLLIEKYHKNVLCYNYYTKKFINMKPDLSPEKYVILYYASHAYTSSLKRLWTYTFGFQKEKFPSSNAEAVKVMEEHISKKEEQKYLKKHNFILAPIKQHAQTFIETVHVHYAFDIETVTVSEAGDQVPYLLVLSSVPEDITKRDKYEVKHWWGTDCINQFIYDFLLPLLCDKKKHYDAGKSYYYHIWAYNGAGFDFHFICDKLQHFIPLSFRGNLNHLKSVVLSEKVQLNDLACWYAPLKVKSKEGKILKGLAALAYECKGPFQKTSLEHTSVTLERIANDAAFKKEAIEYCTQDTIVLASLIRPLAINAAEKFTFKGKKMYFCNESYPCSAASLATSIFRTCFQTGNIYGANSEQQLSREQRSYHGGIVIALKAFAKNIRVMDINSSYPYIMLGNMPLLLMGHYTMKRTITKPCISKIIDTDLYEISSFDFPDDTILPNLVVDSQLGIIMPLRWKAKEEKDNLMAWGCELRAALLQNCSITIVSCDHYDAKPIFKEYVDYFYAAKSEAKKQGNSCIALFNKNMLNSLQGKFGKKFEKEYSVGDIGIIAAEIYEKGYEAIDEIKYVKDGTHQIIWKTSRPQIGRIGSCVRLPSYIAAAARARIITVALPVMKSLVYMDTDSLMLCDGAQISQEYIHEYELGKLKEERHFDYGFFFGAKNYLMFDEGKVDDAYIKVKGIKGIPREQVQSYIQTMKDNGGSTFLSTITPFFVRKFGQVRVTAIQREIQPTFGFKRCQLPDGTSKPYETVEEAVEKFNLTKTLNGLLRNKVKREHLALPKVPKDMREFAESQVRELFVEKSKAATDKLTNFLQNAGIPKSEELANKIIALLDSKEDCELKYTELLEMQLQRLLQFENLEEAILELQLPYIKHAELIEMIKDLFK